MFTLSTQRLVRLFSGSKLYIRFYHTYWKCSKWLHPESSLKSWWTNIQSFHVLYNQYHQIKAFLLLKKYFSIAKVKWVIAGTLTTKKVLQFAYLSIRTILLVVQANIRAKIDTFVTFWVYFDNFKVGSEQNLT